MTWLRRPAPQALVLAGVLLALYAAGASRTIYVGDSGELVTAVQLLGIPHPSGYPLYVLLGKAWTLLVPLGSVAFRMSLFSAAAAAAACAVLYVLARRLRLGALPSLAAAGVLAFSPSFWSQANIQRVYALNALFVVTATLLACIAWEKRRALALVGALLACGLGAGNHLFMAVYAVCLLALVLAERGPLRRPRVLLAAAAAFLVGLLPYAYLPLRSRANPRLDWGDPETLRGFLDVVFRRDFWDRAWYEGPGDLVVAGLDYLRSFATELTWVGAALALLGLLAGRRHARVRILALLVLVANFATMVLHGSRIDLFVWHRYYIPSYVLAALLLGLGCRLLLDRLPSRAAGAALLLPAFLLVVGWRANDRSHYRVADAFSRSLLESLPPGAQLIATDDNVLFSLMYLHLAENVRPDVYLVQQGVAAAHLPPLHFDPDEDAVFFTHHPNWHEEPLDLVPVGMVFQAVRRGTRPAPLALPGELLAGEEDPAVPKDFLTENLIGHYHYMLGVTAELDDWPRARREFDRAAHAAPHNDVLFYNLGLIFRRNGLLDEALEAFRRSQAINPRHLASHGQPRAADRIAEVEREAARLADLERRLDPGEDPPGSALFHLRRAQQLEGLGETAAARGHRLRALLASRAPSDEPPSSEIP